MSHIDAYVCRKMDGTITCIHMTEDDAKRCVHCGNSNASLIAHVKSSLELKQDITYMQANMLATTFHLQTKDIPQVCDSTVVPGVFFYK